MARPRRNTNIRLLGTVRLRRPALLLSTALCSAVTIVVSLPAAAQLAPNARPTGGVVVGGGVAISQSANQTTINQSTPRGAVDWQTFDVGSQQTVQFSQPSSSSLTLNRVEGPNPSQIAGRINANGQIILENQSGVAFYKGSQVNTAGLMVSAATSSNTAAQAFVNGGKLVMDRAANPNATVANGGQITIKDAGLAALVAPQVINSGVISAKLGHVVLAGASRTTLDLYGDGLMAIDVTGQVVQAPDGATALVTNTGIIRADGGTVQLTARAVDGIVQTLVNAGGKIQANTVGDRTGTIVLNGVGGSITVAGQLAATGSTPGSVGGNIAVDPSGTVALAPTARVNASGKAGGGVIAIGTTLARAQGGPTVLSQQTAANATVAAGAKIAANAGAKGNGGRVAVLSSGSTAMNGAISAKGGPQGGNGGFVETSGVGYLTVGSSASVGAAAPEGTPGKWLLDPNSNVTITNATLNVSCTVSPVVCSPSADNSTLGASTINTALNAGTSVTVTTSFDGGQPGNITVGQTVGGTDGEILLSSARTVSLTLDAGSGSREGTLGSITINSPITDAGSGGALSLILSARGAITVNNPVTVAGGLAATAGTTINLNYAAGPVVTTGAGGQTYNEPVVLQAATRLVGTGGGAINFASTVDGGFPLTVNAGTGPVFFGDVVGGTTPLASLTVTGPTTLTENVMTSGTQTYNSAVTLGAGDPVTTILTTTANGAITLNGQVTSAVGNSLTLSSGSGNQTLSGITTTGNLTLTTTGTVTLDSGAYTITGGASPYVFPAVTTNGALTLGQDTSFGAVTLGSATTIDSANTLIQFTSTVDGGFALATSPGTGRVVFEGAVGGATPLASLTVTGLTTLDANVTTSGAQTYSGAVELFGAPNILTTTNAPVDFVSTLDFGQLTVNAGTGTVTFGGAVGRTGPLASLTVTGPTTLDASVSTNGGQTYNSTVTLGNTVTLNSNFNNTANGAIDLAAPIIGGANSLALTSGSGNQTLSGITTSGNLTQTTTGTVTLDGGTYTITGGASPYVFPAVTTNATLTLGQATNFGAVTLGSNTTIDSTNTAIDFTGAVNGGSNSLTLSSGSGNQTLSGITTSGNLTLTTTGTVTLDGGTYTITGGASPYVFPAVTTNGTLTLGQATDFGAVTLGSSTTIDSTNTAIDFAAPIIGGANSLTLSSGSGNQTLSGITTSGNLTLTTTGTVTLDGGTYTITGGANPYVFPAVTTNGTLTLGQPTSFGAVTLGSATTIGGANILFTGTVDGGFPLATNPGAGRVVFESAVGGVAPLASLTVTGLTTLDASVTTSGAQTYNGAVELGAPLGATNILTTANGPVDFTSTVAFGALTVNAGTEAVNFGGAVGGPTPPFGPLASLTVTGPTTLGGNVTTTGAQTYNSAVTLGAPSTLTTTNSAVKFVSTVDATTAGSQGLTVGAGTGAVTFGGAVGGSQALASLTVTGPTALDGNVTTSGAQTYNSAVTLGATSTLATTNSPVDFGSTVDATTAGSQGLTVGAGTGAVTFGGAVGGSQALASLTVTGPTTLDGNVTTSGAQAYNSAVTLGATDTLATTNSPVDFGSTVDATTAGSQGLTVSAGTGAVTYGGAVGGSQALASLTVTGPTILGGNVTTSGAQIYNSALTLSATDTLATTNSPVDFASTVDATAAGSQGLTVSAGIGAVTFGGAVGGSQALASLTVTGPTALGGNVTTTGAQTYNSAVVLGATDTLATTNSAVDFVSTVDATTAGSQGLTVSAGTGAVTFGGAAGASQALASLTVTGPTTLFSGVSTDGSQTYNSAVTLATYYYLPPLITLNSNVNTTANGAITLNGQVTGGADSLTLTSGSGNQTLSGITTSGNLTLMTIGTVTLDGGTYTITGGAIPYVFPAVTTNGVLSLGQATNFGAVTLGSGTTIDGTNLAIGFTGTVNGGFGLVVSAGTGAVNFGGAIGGSQALTSLTVTGPTTLGGSVTTSGAQTYNSAVTLGATDTLTTTDSPVAFASTIDAATAGSQGLTVSAGAGAVTFGGAIGGSMPLANLAAAGGTITLNGNAAVTGVLALDSTGPNSPLAVNTTLGATTVTLIAPAISIPGAITGTTNVGLIATGGGITETGSVTTPLLTGSATAAVSLTGTNNIAALGASAASPFSDVGNTFTLTDRDTALLTVNGVSAATMSLTAPVISIPGAITGTTSVGLIATDGAITESGSMTTPLLTGSAAGNANLTGTNNIAALGVSAASPFSDLGSAFTLTDADAALLTVNGVSAATVSLTAPVIGIPGAITGTTSVGLTATGGGITETGSLVAGILSGNSTGPTSLTGASSTTNQVANLSNFSANGSFILNDGASLLISGPVAADFLTISATGQMTLAGNIATIGAPLAAQSGPNPAPGGSTLQVLPSGTAGQAIFMQTGTVTLTDPPATTLRVQLPTAGNGGTASFANLVGPDANLVLALGGGTARGTMQIGGLLVIGQGGAANLFGSVAGITTAAAAAAAQISPAVNANYTFNRCTIGLAACAIPVPPVTQPVLGSLSWFLPGPFLPPVPGLMQLSLIALPTPPLLTGQLAPEDVVPPNISFEDY